MLLNDKVQFRMQWPQYAELHVNGIVDDFVAQFDSLSYLNCIPA
jgi:EAL domain-containing protein (putative c-di-GMP-specific phosphodiesterase class I)